MTKSIARGNALIHEPPIRPIPSSLKQLLLEAFSTSLGATERISSGVQSAKRKGISEAGCVGEQEQTRRSGLFVQQRRPTVFPARTTASDNLELFGNMLQTGGGRTCGSIARIEVLPSELLFYLSRYLDLAGLIVFSTATSRALRHTFAQFDRELLFLEPSHRLNLAEWRAAARQIESVGLTPSSCVVKASSGSATGTKPDADDVLSETMHQLTKDESLIDLHLFQSVLAFLAHPDSQMNLAASQSLPSRTAITTSHSSETHSSNVNQIRCLHLTGWHGIAGAFLIHQLRTQPSLGNVCTVVKTDRADSRIWEQAAADDRQAQIRICSAEFSAPQGFPPSPVMQFNGCIATQIIVQVGKRRPRRPGQPFLRGEGLQMGYQGYCMETAMDAKEGDAVTNGMEMPTGENGVRAEGGLMALSAADGSKNSFAAEPQQIGLDCKGEVRPVGSKSLHVILQGREVEDGIENEEMFERSIVHCNHCKDRIVF